VTRRLAASGRAGGLGSIHAPLWPVGVAFALLAGCAQEPVAKAYGESLSDCAADEVVVCDHVSRIKSATRLCTCQPERQTLNAEIND